MMRKFSFILSVLLLVACYSVVAKGIKLVERSSKVRPTWTTDLERDYIIVTASGSTVEDAQQKALLFVKQQIAQSIVSDVSTESFHSYTSTQSGSTSLASTSGEIQGSAMFQTQTEQIIRSTTEKIPFLQSILISNASDFYWERFFDKATGEGRFDYYIKYYFPSSELKRLVDEFNANQNRLNSTIKQMRDELDTFTQVETINKNMGILRALRHEFADSDPRISQVDEIVNSYRNQYKNISIVQLSHQNKRVVVQLMLNGRIVSTSQIPTHRSNGADRIVIQSEDGCIVMSYDDYACRSGDDNFIELTFKFGVNYVSTKIYIVK